MHRHAQRSFAHRQARADFHISTVALTRKQASCLTEQSTFAIRVAFAFQCVQCLLQHRERPLPLKVFFRSILVRGLEPITLLRRLLVERNERELPTPLLAMCAAPFSRQEEIE